LLEKQDVAPLQCSAGLGRNSNASEPRMARIPRMQAKNSSSICAIGVIRCFKEGLPEEQDLMPLQLSGDGLAYCHAIGRRRKMPRVQGSGIVDCRLPSEGPVPAMTNRARRAKQSQIWKRWGIWRKRNIACGPVPPESRARQTKPISRRGQGRSRPRHETPYGVTASVTDCTNKANFRAGTCMAIRGERGRGPQSRCIAIGNPRSPYRAKQSQFVDRRRQAGGGRLEETARMICETKPIRVAGIDAKSFMGKELCSIPR
jgi:hypothetical protein